MGFFGYGDTNFVLVFLPVLTNCAWHPDVVYAGLLSPDHFVPIAEVLVDVAVLGQFLGLRVLVGACGAACFEPAVSDCSTCPDRFAACLVGEDYSVSGLEALFPDAVGGVPLILDGGTVVAFGVVEVVFDAVDDLELGGGVGDFYLLGVVV